MEQGQMDIDFISHTFAFPATISQNVCCEKHLLLMVSIEVQHLNLYIVLQMPGAKMHSPINNELKFWLLKNAYFFHMVSW